MKRSLALVAAPIAWLAAAHPALAVGGLAPMEEEPNKGNTLAAAPAAVSVEFGADIDADKSAFTVTDAKGKDAGVETSKVSKMDKRMLTMGLKQPLDAGVYTVAWHVVSPSGQKNQGSYTFTVLHGAAMHALGQHG